MVIEKLCSLVRRRVSSAKITSKKYLESTATYIWASVYLWQRRDIFDDDLVKIHLSPSDKKIDKILFCFGQSF